MYPLHSATKTEQVEVIPFKDGPYCYINTSMKSWWIIWRTVWSSSTLLVTFSRKQLCYQAQAWETSERGWSRIPGKILSAVCGQICTECTTCVCQWTDSSCSPSGSDVLLFYCCSQEKRQHLLQLGKKPTQNWLELPLTTQPFVSSQTYTTRTS